MKPVLPTGAPVNSEDPPAFRGYEALAPSIERLLAIETADFRARLREKLRVCESPIEALFVLSMLAARDDRGHPFILSPNAREPGLFAEGRGGELYAQHEVHLGKKRVRLDFALISKKRRLAIELDGRAAHASEEARASDADRDRLLTAAGWTPVRVIGAEVWRDVDRCSSQVFAILEIAVTHGTGVPRPVFSARTHVSIDPNVTKDGIAKLREALNREPGSGETLPKRPVHPRAKR